MTEKNKEKTEEKKQKIDAEEKEVQANEQDVKKEQAGLEEQQNDSEEKIGDNKPETPKTDDKKDVKEKPKKKEEKKIPKKEEAVAIGRNMHISKKHGAYICAFIKNKKIDNAISDLEQVKKMKKIVPFKGEIPHKKGKGMMSGRYPVKAAGLFINVLKGLKGNVIVNGLDLDNTKIYFASSSWSARPMRSGRREGKRTNVILKAKEFMKGEDKKKEEKK